MLSRFNVFRLVSDLRTSIRDRGKDGNPPDRLSRFVLIALPAFVAWSAFHWSWPLKGGADLIAAFSLTAGVMLAVFALLAGWRTRLAERLSTWGSVEQPDRSLIDEAVRHTLVSTLFCVAGTGLSLWASATTPNDGQAPPALAAACYAVATLVALLITAVVVLAYGAYTETMNSMESENRSLLTDSDRAAFRRGPRQSTAVPTANSAHPQP